MTQVLYVAKCGWDYEGFEIIGIFDSHEAAQSACDMYKPYKGDYTEVAEFILNVDEFAKDEDIQATIAWRREGMKA